MSHVKPSFHACIARIRAYPPGCQIETKQFFALVRLLGSTLGLDMQSTQSIGQFIRSRPIEINRLGEKSLARSVTYMVYKDIAISVYLSLNRSSWYMVEIRQLKLMEVNRPKILVRNKLSEQP